MTALIYAARNGHSDTVRVLIEAGASPEAKNTVSKRISICTCVCVRLLYSYIIVYDMLKVLFYSILIFCYCFNNNYFFACVVAC